jgi:WD40 repeat protein
MSQVLKRHSVQLCQFESQLDVASIGAVAWSPSFSLIAVLSSTGSLRLMRLFNDSGPSGVYLPTFHLDGIIDVSWIPLSSPHASLLVAQTASEFIFCFIGSRKCKIRDLVGALDQNFPKLFPTAAAAASTLLIQTVRVSHTQFLKTISNYMPLDESKCAFRPILTNFSVSDFSSLIFLFVFYTIASFSFCGSGIHKTSGLTDGVALIVGSTLLSCFHVDISQNDISIRLEHIFHPTRYASTPHHALHCIKI